jgi:hypothetical protein
VASAWQALAEEYGRRSGERQAGTRLADCTASSVVSKAHAIRINYGNFILATKDRGDR